MLVAQGSRARRIGAYIVGRRIGSGGMAIVDAAYHVGSPGGRLVALKRLPAAFSHDPSARRLFLREASIVARLEHPNVVRTYEVGEIHGEIFIAMELLEGATVAQLQGATGERMPLQSALRIVRDALRGLHAAHELCGLGGKVFGLVHQDISPQNIHVAYEGTSRVLDFGVARLAAVDVTRRGSVCGKPCYLSPEQLGFGAIDRRADIFAMGIVLYELLTGTYLFPRASADAAYAAILSENMLPPRSTRPEVPEAIDAVVRRALAPRADDRFATAEEMRCALVAAQDLAGVVDIDVASLGTWVEATVPPVWTRSDVELEIALGQVETCALDVTEEATLPPRAVDEAGYTRSSPPAGMAKATYGAQRSRVMSLAAAATLGVLAVVAVAASRAPATPVPPPSAASVSEREPGPPAPRPLALLTVPEPPAAAPAPSSPPAVVPAHGARGAPSPRRPAVVSSAASAQPVPSSVGGAPATEPNALRKPDVYEEM